MEAVKGRIADRGAAPALAVICLSSLGRPRPVSYRRGDGHGRAHVELSRPQFVLQAQWPSAGGWEDWESVAPSRTSPLQEQPAPGPLLRSPAGVLAANAASRGALSAHSKQRPSKSCLGGWF